VNPGTDHETDISVDYSQPLVKGYALETGAKAVLENIHTDAATDTLLSGGTTGRTTAGNTARMHRSPIILASAGIFTLRMCPSRSTCLAIFYMARPAFATKAHIPLPALAHYDPG